MSGKSKKCCIKASTDGGLKKKLEERGCLLNEPKIVLSLNDNVLVKCGNCRVGMSKNCFKELKKMWEEAKKNE